MDWSPRGLWARDQVSLRASVCRHARFVTFAQQKKGSVAVPLGAVFVRVVRRFRSAVRYLQPSIFPGAAVHWLFR